MAPSMLLCSRLWLIQIFLESHEYLANLVRPTEISDSVGYGVVVFQAKQWRQFVLVELIHADTHVMR